MQSTCVAPPPAVRRTGPVRTLDEIVYAEIVHACRTYETQREAAIALGVSEKTIYNKLTEYRRMGWPTA